MYLGIDANDEENGRCTSCINTSNTKYSLEHISILWKRVRIYLSKDANDTREAIVKHHEAGVKRN